MTDHPTPTQQPQPMQSFPDPESLTLQDKMKALLNLRSKLQREGRISQEENDYAMRLMASIQAAKQTGPSKARASKTPSVSLDDF